MPRNLWRNRCTELCGDLCRNARSKVGRNGSRVALCAFGLTSLLWTSCSADDSATGGRTPEFEDGDGGVDPTADSGHGENADGGGDQESDAAGSSEARLRRLRHEVLKKGCVCINCVEEIASPSFSRAENLAALEAVGCRYARQAFSPFALIKYAPAASTDDVFRGLRESVAIVGLPSPSALESWAGGDSLSGPSTSTSTSTTSARGVFFEFELPAIVTENFVASLRINAEERATLDRLAEEFNPEYSGLEDSLTFEAVGAGHIDRWGDFSPSGDPPSASRSRNSVPTLLTRDGWHYHVLLSLRAIEAGARAIYLRDVEDRLSPSREARAHLDRFARAVKKYALTTHQAFVFVGVEGFIGDEPEPRGSTNPLAAPYDFETFTIDTDVAFGSRGDKYVRASHGSGFACHGQAFFDEEREAETNAHGQLIGDLCFVRGDERGYGRAYSESESVPRPIDFETRGAMGLPALLELSTEATCALSGAGARPGTDVVYYENYPDDARTTCASIVRNGLSGLMQFASQPAGVRSAFARSMAKTTKEFRSNGVPIYFPQLLHAGPTAYRQLTQNTYGFGEAELSALRSRVRSCPREAESEWREYSGSDEADVYSATDCGDRDSIVEALALSDDALSPEQRDAIVRLPSGLTLRAGEFIGTRRFIFLMRRDGNLVLLEKGQAAPAWTTDLSDTGCEDSSDCEASFLTDGALVVRKGEDVLWTSGTSGQGAVRIVLSSKQPNLSIQGGRAVLWAVNAMSPIDPPDASEPTDAEDPRDAEDSRDAGGSMDGTISTDSGASTDAASANQCALPDGGTMEEGDERVFYAKSRAVLPDDCQNHRQRRVCRADGTLSGDAQYQFTACATVPPAGCDLPWGGSIQHGESRIAYQNSTVPFERTCASENRACSNGDLSGSYAFPSCAVSAPASCMAPWGESIAHGESRTAYAVNYVPYGSTCPSEVRACYDGELSGSNNHPQCRVGPEPNHCEVYGGQNLLATLSSGEEAGFYIKVNEPAGPGQWNTVCETTRVRCVCGSPDSCGLQQLWSWGWGNGSNGAYYANSSCTW